MQVKLMNDVIFFVPELCIYQVLGFAELEQPFPSERSKATKARTNKYHGLM